MSPTWYGLVITLILLAGSGLFMAGVALVREGAASAPIPVRARYRRTPPR